MKRRICAASYSSGLPETVTSTSDTFTLPRWTERHYAAMADVLLIETDVQLTRLIEWIIEGAGHQVGPWRGRRTPGQNWLHCPGYRRL